MEQPSFGPAGAFLPYGFRSRPPRFGRHAADLRALPEQRAGQPRFAPLRELDELAADECPAPDASQPAASGSAGGPTRPQLLPAGRTALIAGQDGLPAETATAAGGALERAAGMADRSAGHDGPSQGAVQSLVERAQGGDSSAFAQIYQIHARRVLMYLRNKLGGQEEVAEDLAMDVFIKAMEKLHLYRNAGVPFQAWLFRIAHNRLIDHVRFHQRRPGLPLDECQGVDDPAAEDALDETLTQEQLSGALRNLTVEQRQVIHYRFVEDRSIAATAQLMAKNVDAIKQLQVRALRSMRRSLEWAY